MIRTRRSVLGLLLAWTVVAFCFDGAAFGQNNVAGFTALENASGGAVRGRTPGNMVQAGVARTLEAADFARGGITIVETERPMPWQRRFLIDALDIIFEELNQAVALLGGLLVSRGGGELTDITDLIPDIPDDGTTVDGRDSSPGRK
jgi:hypothetical protein